VPLALGGAVLASGEAARFGGNKLLADFQGRALVARAFSCLPEGLNRRVVVTRWPEVASLGRAAGLTAVRHDFPDVSDSIRLASEAMAGLDGAVFLVGDQPLLTLGSVARLISAFSDDPLSAVRLSWQGVPGNPVVFPALAFPFLRTLSPGETGRSALKRAGIAVRLVEASHEWEMRDCDTPAALEAVRRFAAERRL
jgi:molybdenum cofactor cytidylyltransferase